MKLQETLSHQPAELIALKKLVAHGEGLHLEFKRKVAFPEKIVRELIAFANTEGGRLLIGVDDDGSLPGVKYPEEEIHLLETALQVHCRPQLSYEKKIIPLSKKKFVVVFEIPVSNRRPHRLIQKGEHPATYIRVNDTSVKASREMQEIVRRRKSVRNIQFRYGHHESVLMKYLAEHKQITLAEFCRVASLKRFIASRKLVTLVLANVLKVTPGQPDVYAPVAG